MDQFFFCRTNKTKTSFFKGRREGRRGEKNTKSVSANIFPSLFSLKGLETLMWKGVGGEKSILTSHFSLEEKKMVLEEEEKKNPP